MNAEYRHIIRVISQKIRDISLLTGYSKDIIFLDILEDVNYLEELENLKINNDTTFRRFIKYWKEVFIYIKKGIWSRIK